MDEAMSIADAIVSDCDASSDNLVEHVAALLAEYFEDQVTYEQAVNITRSAIGLTSTPLTPSSDGANETREQMEHNNESDEEASLSLSDNEEYITEGE
eukprot:930193-Ditylum_brightwellii.AAC.1